MPISGPQDSLSACMYHCRSKTLLTQVEHFQVLAFPLLQCVVVCVRMEGAWMKETAPVRVQVALVGLTVKVSSFCGAKTLRS